MEANGLLITRSIDSRSHRVTQTRYRKHLAHEIPVVVLFSCIWALILWQTYSSLNNLHPSSSGINPQVLSLNSLAKDVTVKENWNEEESNPYFGWQPSIATQQQQQTTCSWRECFKPDHSHCRICRDLPEDMGQVPEPPSGWVPDVTMLHRMRMRGKDSQGRPWPPPLDSELCQDIGNVGGTHDDNKARKLSRHATMS